MYELNDVETEALSRQLKHERHVLSVGMKKTVETIIQAHLDVEKEVRDVEDVPEWEAELQPRRGKWWKKEKPADDPFKCEVCGGTSGKKLNDWDYCSVGHVYVGKRSGL